MSMIQALGLDVKFLDFEPQMRLNFNAKSVQKNIKPSTGTGTSPEERLDQSVASKSVHFPEMALYVIQIGSFSTNQQALPTYTEILKNGYGATVYEDQVIRILIAAAPTEDAANHLVKTYEDEFESISVERIGITPRMLAIEESVDASRLVKATEMLAQLLTEANDFMAIETLTPHKSKEKKAFLKAQNELILNGRQALDETFLTPSLSRARENVLQLFKDHEIYLSAWSEKRRPTHADLWQGLLSEIFLYKQIVR